MPISRIVEEQMIDHLTSQDIDIPDIALISLSEEKATEIIRDMINKILNPYFEAALAEAEKAGFTKGYNRSDPGKALNYMPGSDDDVDPRHPKG